jgi:hypothetical protein
VPPQDDVLKDNKRNKILQINNVYKTSKRLKNDVDIENHRIIQTERQVTTRILLRLDFGLRPLTTKIRLM